MFILAAVCGPGTNGSLLPRPGCGAAPAAGEREDASVTWQSGEEPAALPTGTSAGAARSPPFMRPAALPMPQRREAGRPPCRPAARAPRRQGAPQRPTRGAARGRAAPPCGPRRAGPLRVSHRSCPQGCGVRSSRNASLRYCVPQTLLLRFPFVFLSVSFSRLLPEEHRS